MKKILLVVRIYLYKNTKGRNLENSGWPLDREMTGNFFVDREFFKIFNKKQFQFVLNVLQKVIYLKGFPIRVICFEIEKKTLNIHSELIEIFFIILDILCHL